MPLIRPTAIVIKLDCVTGLDTARILSRHEIPVIGIADNPKDYCCKTTSCKEIISCSTTDKNLLDTLLNLAKRFEAKPVLFPCSDESVLILSENREILKEFYNFVIPDADVLDLYMNKRNFYRYSRENGFPIPATYFPSNVTDLEDIIKRASFPCSIKPVMKTPNWYKHFNHKVVKVMSPEELSESFVKCSSAGESVIVQEWIEGTDSDLYSCIFYYNEDYNQEILFTSRKLRQWLIDSGDASLAQEWRNDSVLEITEELLGRIKFRVIGSIEYKQDSSSGRYFVTEPNIGRPVSRIGLVEDAGVLIIQTMYCDASGLPLPSHEGQLYGDVKWILLRNDVLSAWTYYKKGELSLWGWIKSLHGEKSYAVLSVRDPLPFITLIYMDLSRLCKRFLRRIYKRLVRSTQN